MEHKSKTGSPLDVLGVDSGLSREDIVKLVRESRRSSERFIKGKRIVRSD